MEDKEVWKEDRSEGERRKRQDVNEFISKRSFDGFRWSYFCAKKQRELERGVME